MADEALDEVLRRMATIKDLADLRREMARRTLWAVAAMVVAAVLLAG